MAVLGTLKAGGAYVPLDPSYPAERLAYMLARIGDPVVPVEALKHGNFARGSAELRGRGDRCGFLDGFYGESGSGASVPDRSSQAAYVVYDPRGSTGTPKGTVIEHRNVLNLWHGLQAPYGRAGVGQRVALNASLNFDASVQQWVQLLSGRTVVIVPADVRRDASLLLSFMHSQQIEAIDCTPSQLKSWVSAGLLDGDQKAPSAGAGGRRGDRRGALGESGALRRNYVLQRVWTDRVHRGCNRGPGEREWPHCACRSADLEHADLHPG